MVGTATGKIGHLAKDHAEWASRSEKGHAPTQNHKAKAKTAVDLEIVLKELHAILVKSVQVSHFHIIYWSVEFLLPRMPQLLSITSGKTEALP